jgi:hypothetical protein
MKAKTYRGEITDLIREHMREHPGATRKQVHAAFRAAPYGFNAKSINSAIYRVLGKKYGKHRGTMTGSTRAAQPVNAAAAPTKKKTRLSKGSVSRVDLTLASGDSPVQLGIRNHNMIATLEVSERGISARRANGKSRDASVITWETLFRIGEVGLWTQ